MGKGHQHMKKLKSEKAKVKLKGSKHLPKGTNVTDTSFKIKQIVIREQLKAANEADHLSKRKLNVKELLSRLQHYNKSVKNDAINDLKQIVSLYPNEIVIPNLCQLIQGVSHLILDRENNVRRESLNLISMILTAVSVEQVSPFFEILSSYFRCAMTHIDISIQEDSLFLLDILLTHTPSLVATHSNKIMENFFDLISKLRANSKPGRTLTVNLNSKQTTVKWRIKVLNRLKNMLDAIYNEKQKNSTAQCNIKEVKHVTFESATDSSAIYNYKNFIPVPLNIDMKQKVSETDDNIIKYIDVLVPLLNETWLEVGPNSKIENNETDVILTEEAASVLNCILNIFQLLHSFIKIYEKETGNLKIEKEFILKYRDSFINYIFNYFPYSKTGSMKRKKNASSEGNLSFCVSENFMICTIFCIFNNKICADDLPQKKCAEKMLKYIYKTDVLIRRYAENDDQSKQAIILLRRLFLMVDKSWNGFPVYGKILKTVINISTGTTISGKIQADIFDIFCEMIHIEHLYELPVYQKWLCTLPLLLVNSEISGRVIKMISVLLKQNNKLFNKSMTEQFADILTNISTVTLIETDNVPNFKTSVIGLVHYLPADHIEEYMEVMFASDCELSLKQYFIEVLEMRYPIYLQFLD